jgi:hypothetical protein
VDSGGRPLFGRTTECVAEMERDEAALLADRSLVNLCQCSRVRVLVKEFTTRRWVP